MSNAKVVSFVFATDELSARLSGQKAKQLVNQLRDFGIFVSADNEKKVWSFLETRAELLLQAYPTTTEVTTQ